MLVRVLLLVPWTENSRRRCVYSTKTKNIIVCFQPNRKSLLVVGAEVGRAPIHGQHLFQLHGKERGYNPRNLGGG